MIAISCPKCGKEYVFDETKIPNDIEMIECKICKTRFLLDWDQDLFVDPLEDLSAAEERLSAEASLSSGLEAKQPRAAVDPIESSSRNPIAEVELAHEPLEELDSWAEDVPDPDLEVVEKTRFPDDHQASLPTFCAERFRMLNAKNKKKETKLLLYGLLALASFMFLCFVIYSGR